MADIFSHSDTSLLATASTICSLVRPVLITGDTDDDDPIHAGPYKEAYPGAKLIGPEDIVHKKELVGLQLDGGTLMSPCIAALRRLTTGLVYSASNPDAKHGFEDEVRSSSLRLLTPPLTFSNRSKHGAISRKNDPTQH